MEPNSTDINNAIIELMVQSTKQSDRIKALEAENERLRVRVHQLLDCLEWVTNLYPNLEGGIEEKLKEAWPIKTYAQLAAHPWTYLIDDKGRAVEGALPEDSTDYEISVRYSIGDGHSITMVGYLDGDTWKKKENNYPVTGKVYAYREWTPPAPAPYPVEET